MTWNKPTEKALDEARRLKTIFLINSTPEKPDFLGMARMMRAVAINRHAGQKRDDGRPFVVHPLEVGDEHSYSPERMIAGWGHDLVEDTDVTLKELETMGFTPRIVTDIDLLSQRKGAGWVGINGATTCEDWKERIFDQAVRIGAAAGTVSGDDAAALKISDGQSNNRDDAAWVGTGHTLSEKRRLKHIARETIMTPYLRAIAERKIEPGMLMGAFIRERLRGENCVDKQILMKQFSSEDFECGQLGKMEPRAA